MVIQHPPQTKFPKSKLRKYENCLKSNGLVKISAIFINSASVDKSGSNFDLFDKVTKEHETGFIFMKIPYWDLRSL